MRRRKKGKVEEWVNRFESDHHHIRRKAIEALGNIDDDRAIKLLVKALNDEDTFVRRKAVKGLGKRGDVQTVEPLMKALKDTNWHVREEAAVVLGIIGDTRAVEFLIESLEDHVVEVRGRAAQALGQIGDARAVKPLIKKAFGYEEKDWFVQAKCAEGWETLVSVSSGSSRVTPLVKALREITGKEKEEAIKVLKKVWEPFDTIAFGDGALHFINQRTMLLDLDVSEFPEITTFMLNPKKIVIHSETYNFHYIEHFITYAVNYIGQEYLRKIVEVHIYGNQEQLHPNIYNVFKNLCKNIEVHNEN